METKKEFDAVVQKERNEAVLKATLDYLDNHNVAWGISAMKEFYRSWKNVEESKVLHKEIRLILKFLIELGKADVKMVDMAEKRLTKLIKQKKEQQKL